MSKSIFFEPKLIPDLLEYKGSFKHITINHYSKYRHSMANINKLEQRGLIIRSASFTYYDNNPIFKRHDLLQTIISAN